MYELLVSKEAVVLCRRKEGRNLGRRCGSGIEVKEINSGEWQLEIVQNTTFADKDLFFSCVFKNET